MKKLVCLMMLALISITASAATVSLHADQTVFVPGEIITISVISTGNCTNIAIPEIISTAGGIASNFFLNPGFNQFPQAGTMVNAGNVLITGVSGATPFAFPPVPVVAGTALYSFDFTLPYVDIWSPLTISGAGNLSFMFDDFSQVTELGSVTFFIIPEPITIALLGLGGLFLRRRK